MTQQQVPRIQARTPRESGYLPRIDVKKSEQEAPSVADLVQELSHPGPGHAEPEPPFPWQQPERPGLDEELDPEPMFENPEYKGSDKLEGQVALITGGDSGIGRSVAVHFAREGADVAIVFLPEEETDAEDTQQAVHDEGGDCLLLPGDVKGFDFCREAVERTVQRYGRLDVLVNNAARQQSRQRIEELSLEQWDLTFRTNIYGYFHMVKAALPYMNDGARIINTGSVTGLRGNKQMIDYSATKGAIHAFTKSLAQQLVDRGIRVNCVAPGPVWTPLNPVDGPPERTMHFGEDKPMGRPAQPEEIAPAFVFFASNVDSSYITGEVLTLLGGETLPG